MTEPQQLQLPLLFCQPIGSKRSAEPHRVSEVVEHVDEDGVRWIHFVATPPRAKSRRHGRRLYSLCLGRVAA